MAATQLGRWSGAALLWRDLWRRNRPDPLAAACAAEAALRSDQLGLADHMLAQLPETPRYLEDLITAAEPLRRARMELHAATDHERRDDPIVRAQRPGEVDRAPITPADARSGVESFFYGHPLARLADHELARLVTDGICPLPATFDAADNETRLRQRALLVPPARMRIDHKTVKKVSKRLSAADPDGAELARLILALERANLSERDALMQDACHRLAELEAAGRCTPVVLAGLYHKLGLSTFARMLLGNALTHCDDPDERREIRRGLAGIAADRDRLSDHANELHADDFREQQTRAARAALLAHFAGRRGDVGPAAPEPLVNAFDFLLSGTAADVAHYAPANRLLLVGSRLGCGGTEMLMASAYRHFSRCGDFDAVDMALLSFKTGTPSAFYASQAGLRGRDVVVLDPGGPADLPFSLLPGDRKARGQKLFDHIVATRPRVIHAWDDPTGVLAAFAALAAGCPRVVIHFHHCPPAALRRPAETVASYPAVFRRLVDLPQFAFAFCSDAAAEDYARWWGIPRPARFHTVYNGFEWTPSCLSKADARRRIGIPPAAPVIGTVIRFTPVKQPLVWAEAAVRLAAELPSAHFLMVGDGWLRQRVSEALTAAGLGGRFHMPGEVADVPDYLAAMDLFWLTSRSEGLGNVLIEAQRAGVPVLAFDCGGPREAMIDGETGILIPPGDSEQLAESSRRLLQDPARLAETGHRGRMYAGNRFTATEFFNGLSALYGG
jgi:glycosyltransferase involved in cell wall biosynthesis